MNPKTGQGAKADLDTLTQDGQPVECFLTHGGFGDVDALKYYAYELPDGAIIYAAKAYNDYEIEGSSAKPTL